MEITIRVVTADGEYVVVTSLYNIVQLERRFKTSISALASGFSIEQLAFLAWEAAKDAGHKPPATLDAFIQSVVKLEIVEEAEEARPTKAAA